MTKIDKRIIEEVKAYVAPLYANSELSYHNFSHVQNVVSMVKKLGKSEGLSKDQRNKLAVAGYFHDVGYGQNEENHEELSAQMAEKYLTDQLIDSEDIQEVKTYILATKMGRIPQSKEEEIIKDADLGHLGMVDFFLVSEGLRTEKSKKQGDVIPEEDWSNRNLEFLLHHKYYTQSAKDLLDKQKFANIKLITQMNKENAKKLKDASPDRGIETMFRVALRNHNALSQIADNKANILLSVSTIMLSLLLSSLIPKVGTDSILMWPTIITIVVCLTTMYFAVMATRPKINHVPHYSREMVLENKTNLLFFGNFKNLDLEEYEWGIGEMMKDKDLLYGALTKDLFFLGKVLNNKYAFLSKGYNIFIFGLMLSVASFILAILL